MQLYTSSEIHWLLMDNQSPAPGHGSYGDCCCDQALFCPYYVPLEGALGADWGVIINPASARFGLLTFEHHSCGCPSDALGHVLHVEGQQSVDEWRIESCHDIHTFEDDKTGICIKPKGHKTHHQDGAKRQWE